jgi:rare lipoprotein A
LKNRLLLAGAGAFAVVLATATLAPAGDVQCGDASWYALAGNRTASGEIMNPSAMTAAHRRLAFGTRVKVTNQNNGRELVVTINDRGPFIGGRIIDVSKAAARELGFQQAGTANVCLTRI